VDDAADALDGVLARVVEQLTATGARDEAMGEFRRRRGVLGIGSGERLVPVGRAWRLGRVLLTADRRLFEVGSVTRAVDPRHPNYQSVSGEQRREVRRAAFEGDFAAGESVNHGFREISLDGAGDRILSTKDGAVAIEWAPGQTPMPLERYLLERAELLAKIDGWDESAGGTEGA
jgi:hypothetical protein